MKALSIRQPWAWLIVNGYKKFENRDWQPRNPCRKFRGRVLIHASKGMTMDEYEHARQIANDFGVRIPDAKDLERGGIVGEAEIVAWHDSPPAIYFAFGSGLEIKNASPCHFTPTKGALGFFNVPWGKESLDVQIITE